MLSKDEIKKWILENCVNENGNIDLSCLDFSDFDGDVNISEMKVKGNLYQYSQEVKGDLLQFFQKVEGDLCQTGTVTPDEYFYGFAGLNNDSFYDFLKNNEGEDKHDK